MKKLLPALLLLLASPASGDIYTWKDTKGTTHYTNSVYEIPERYRAKAKVLNLGIDPKGTPAGATGGAASPLPSPLPVTASPSPPPATTVPSAPPVSPSPPGPSATSSPSSPPATVLPSPSPAVRQQQGMSDRAAAKAARARQRATRVEE